MSCSATHPLSQVVLTPSRNNFGFRDKALVVLSNHQHTPLRGGDGTCPQRKAKKRRVPPVNRRRPRRAQKRRRRRLQRKLRRPPFCSSTSFRDRSAAKPTRTASPRSQ